jgi:Domain of unknown function (DUF5655)
MAIDYGEKERAFIDGLKEATGRDLAEWMAAITAQELAHRNDIIDWLRQNGFMFSKASWLERILHNGGRPIYADAAKSKPRVRRPRSDAGETPSRPAAPNLPIPANDIEDLPPQVQAPASSPSSDGLAEVLAKAKAYRPLAQHVIARIKSARPAASFEPRETFVVIADPDAFAILGIGAKELRLHLALGEHATDDRLKKGVAGGGLGKEDALSHMLVLTDARQVDQRLLELIRLAAAKVNG